MSTETAAPAQRSESANTAEQICRRNARRLSAWDRWYRYALPAYWIFVFACTHLPYPDLRFIPVAENDKILHTLGFAPLAYLFWRFAETLRRPPSGWFVWIAWLTLAAYAAFDEWTQQYVGRGTELGDWLCNTAGMSAVLAALEWRRRKRKL